MSQLKRIKLQMQFQVSSTELACEHCPTALDCPCLVVTALSCVSNDKILHFSLEVLNLYKINTTRVT